MAHHEVPRNIALQDRVVSALRRSGSIDCEHLGVSAHEGVVTISGSVVGAAMPGDVRGLVARIDGVLHVINEIVVRTPRHRDLGYPHP